MCWIIVISLLVITLFLVWASADISSNIYVKTICKGNSEDQVAALTFDDGPDEVMTERVLDVLKRHNIKATFFLIGEKVDKFPHIVRSMVEEGHTVANHTYSHKATFPMSSAENVKQELQKCNDAIYKATGLRTKLFRPPFGVTNPIIGKVLKRSDYKTIGWSIRSLDTINDKSRNDVADKVIGKLHRGAIILLHDRCNDADVLLETIIASAIEKKYTFVPLDELLKIDAYEN